MTSLINRIIDVYAANVKTKLPKRALLLEKISLFSEMIVIGGTIVYVSCAVFHLMIPIYAYFWQHELKPLMPLYIPFVDEKTAIGFSILLSIHIAQAFAMTASTACVDLSFMIVALNIRIFGTIFDDNVNELNELLRMEKVDMPLAAKKFRSIFEIYYDNWM